MRAQRNCATIATERNSFVASCCLASSEKSDEEVLDFGATNSYLTLSFDKTLFFGSGHVIVGRNPGGLILREDDDSIRQMSTRTAPKLLGAFKEQFPDWHTLPWNNSIVELTPTLIFIYQTMTAPPELVELLKRDEAGWPERLRELLEQNAQLESKK